jgi:hypothetical protein
MTAADSASPDAIALATIGGVVPSALRCEPNLIRPP